MVEILTKPIDSKLTDSQDHFCIRIFNLYQSHTGHEFDKRLRDWLFFDQITRLRAADFLAFLPLFDICADYVEMRDKECGHQCYYIKVCRHIYDDIICSCSDYSPHKIGGSDSSYFPEPPILHGPAVELVRFLDSFGL